MKPLTIKQKRRYSRLAVNIFMHLPALFILFAGTGFGLAYFYNPDKYINKFNTFVDLWTVTPVVMGSILFFVLVFTGLFKGRLYQVSQIFQYAAGCQLIPL